MNYIGIDIGSTCAKTVVLNEKKEIIQEFVQPTGWSSVDTAEEIHQKLELAGINLSDDSSCCVATGYGRISVPYADKTVTEITCHALGAVHLFQQPDPTVIDIGGQDVKILHIENGAMVNFQMNDKCAAGTGRFLDVMARVLEVKVSDLAMLGAMSTKEVAISSTCTVFAESEVISQLSMGTNKCDIINGIHNSVASRVVGLAHRVGVVDRVVMTGGVAQNTGVVKALEKQLGHEISTSPLTQYNGALGAALFAYQRVTQDAK